MHVGASPPLADALRNSPLLTPAQQTELTQTLRGRYPDARALARQLLERGWLTSYQVNQLFQGKGADLVLGPYVLLERLGEGGTGRVFKARHQHMNRVVALKVIRPELVSDPEVVGRFRREVQVVSQLTHPNIVHAYDAGPAGSSYFLVTEYVVGTDLDRLVRQKGRLPPEQACDFLRQALLGLQHIHEQGLVHRDIKPSNLLVTEAHGSQPGGVVKILDLGLARLQRPVEDGVTAQMTGTVVTMGTVDFMAPEQALDFHGVDMRGDLYSLGCTFYFGLTGQVPYPGGAVTQKLMRHQQGQVPDIDQVRHDVPPGLTACLRRMMAKRPQDRLATPLEVIRSLPVSAPIATLVTPRTGALVPVLAAPHALVVTAPAALPAQRSLLLAPRRLVRLPRLPRLRRGRVLVAAGVAAAALLLVGWLAIRPSGPSADARSSNAPLEGKVVFLSDLPEIKPKVYWQAKFGKNGNLGWQDKRVMLNGVLSPKGLGMVVPAADAASVSYRLDKQYRLFKATATLNDSAARAANPMRFVVVGDGRVLWQSNPIQKRGDQQECQADVSGVDTLELVVTCPGENGDGHAVWIEPQLLR